MYKNTYLAASILRTFTYKKQRVSSNFWIFNAYHNENHQQWKNPLIFKKKLIVNNVVNDYNILI